MSIANDNRPPPIDEIEFARVVGFIGHIAERVGREAGVGGADMAGMIISYLYAHPEEIPAFLTKGAEAMVDDPLFNLHNGKLTFCARNGTVISPIPRSAV